MKTLYEAIQAGGSKNARYVINHLEAAGIRGWKDCTKVNLSELCGKMTEAGVCQATAYQYISVLKAVLNRYGETGVVPCSDIKEALRCKNERAQKVFLTDDELAKFESVPATTTNELFVKRCFLISAKTGMRVSDTLRVAPENISGGLLRYVSQKTSIEACVPISDKTAKMIDEVNKYEDRPNTGTYEAIVKRLCRRAGITASVKLFKGGKEDVKEKCDYVTSHTARVTFCTLLSQKGVPIQDIATMAGHSSTLMTENYIVRTAPKLNASALAFLK